MVNLDHTNYVTIVDNFILDAFYTKAMEKLD